MSPFNDAILGQEAKAAVDKKKKECDGDFETGF